MFCFLCFVVAFVVLLLILKKTQVDFTLAFFQIFGKEAKHLSGKVVWITGASSGIGEYLAYELASVGCKLVLSARREEELERVKNRCAAIAKANKDDFLVVPLDVTKFDTHSNALKTVLDHFGQVDILVNNSGRSQRSLAVDTEFKVDQAMFDVNVLGTISLTKVVLPHMVERKTGHIVTVSSGSGKFGTATGTTYSATKFALQGFFDALRGEVYNHNIAVTMVCPGPVKSGIVDNAYTEQADKTNKDKNVKENLSRRMDTDRCVKLMAIGIANKLDEVWISILPEILVFYAAQYLPSTTQWISKRIVMKAMHKIRGIGLEKKEQ